MKCADVALHDLVRLVREGFEAVRAIVRFLCKQLLVLVMDRLHIREVRRVKVRT